ncbi:MAG TPA: D-alanine--D-alanine ligase, partial [Gammaproteobacteria bacterium]|nr:D-alanine--D-alanine ligase [Gammaproteobacteria bacterium]
MSLKFPKPLNELKIAVVMGGESSEREVSLNSGNAVLDALLSSGVKAVAIDGVKELLASNPQNFDAVFNILHGESGENGHLA